MIPEGEVLIQRDALAEVNGSQQAQSLNAVLRREQRHRVGVSGEPLLRGVTRILFLQVAAVGQKQREQLRCGGRAIDRPIESLLVQARQVASVVNVRVSEDDLVNLGWIRRQRLPVTLSQFLQSLKESAVNQRGVAGSAQQILRAGH